MATHALPPPLYLRRSFVLERQPVRARLYSTAHGIYQARLNGSRVGDSELAPGWTEYRHRLQYQTHDVTASLQVGENVLGAVVADGWWAGTWVSIPANPPPTTVTLPRSWPASSSGSKTAHSVR